MEVLAAFGTRLVKTVAAEKVDDSEDDLWSGASKYSIYTSNTLPTTWSHEFTAAVDSHSNCPVKRLFDLVPALFCAGDLRWVVSSLAAATRDAPSRLSSNAVRVHVCFQQH